MVVLSARGVLHGHDGVRESAGLLYQAIRHADRYVYENVQCEERMALLEWRAEGRTSAIRDGVDSYLIEAGRIVGQTIHYTVISRELSVAALPIRAARPRRPRIEPAWRRLG